MKLSSKPVVAHALLIFVVFVWGSTFVLVKDALSFVSPLFFNLLRMAVALAVMAAVYRKHLKTVDLKMLLKGGLVGLFLGVGYQFQTEGLKFTTPSKSAFITGLCAAMVPALLIFPPLRAEKNKAPSLGAFIGSAAALAGLALLTLPAGAPASSLLSDLNRGDILTLAAALFFALQIVAIAKFAGDMSYEHMSLLQIGSAALLMAMSGPALEHFQATWTPVALAALAVTAVLGTALAFSAQSFAQQVLPATTVVLIMALEPVFAALTSCLFFGERLGPRETAGAVLIIAGILAVELLPRLSWGPPYWTMPQED